MFVWLRLRRAHLAAALLLASVTAGCSYLLVNGPSENGLRTGNLTCTTTDHLPTLDLITAGIAGAGALFAASSDPDWGTAVNKTETVVVFAAATAGWSSAGFVGLNKVDACLEAHGISPKGWDRGDTTSRRRHVVVP